MRRNVELGLVLTAVLLIQLSSCATLKRRLPVSRTTLQFVPVRVVYSDDIDDTFLEGKGRDLSPGVEGGATAEAGPPSHDEEDDEEEDDDEENVEDKEDEDDEDDEDKDDDEEPDIISKNKEPLNSKNKEKQPPKKVPGTSAKPPLGSPKQEQRAPGPVDEDGEPVELIPMPPMLQEALAQSQSFSKDDISEARLLFNRNPWNGFTHGSQGFW